MENHTFQHCPNPNPISFSQPFFGKTISNDAERTAWVSQLAMLYRHLKKTEPVLQMHVSARCSSLETHYPIEYRVSFMRDTR